MIAGRTIVPAFFLCPIGIDVKVINMNKKPSYGGMAVIEGVMMRGPEDTALAVRKPDGTIQIEKETNSDLRTRYPFLRWPLIRGSYVLIESMVVGIKMLNKSANMSLEEEEEELSTKEILVTGVIAFVMAIVLFVALPTAIVHFTKQFIGGVLGIYSTPLVQYYHAPQFGTKVPSPRVSVKEPKPRNSLKNTASEPKSNPRMPS